MFLYVFTKHRQNYCVYFTGGRQSFFRVIISFGLGPPEVALYMTGTFGEVFGPRSQTDSEPRPARKEVPKITISPRGSNLVK